MCSLLFSVEKINKTAGYHRHFFHPLIFLKMLFKDQKLFFPRAFPLFFPIALNFWIFSDFSPKNFTIKVEKSFFRDYINWYAFCCKFAFCNNFEKFQVFLEETHLLFQKGSKFRAFWIILLFQSHIVAVCYNLFKKISESVHLVVKHWALIIGKYRVKRNVRVDWMIFFPCFKCWRKTMNESAVPTRGISEVEESAAI